MKQKTLFYSSASRSGIFENEILHHQTQYLILAEYFLGISYSLFILLPPLSIANLEILI